MKGHKPFDFAIFDEAHKTTGSQAGLFAFGLSDKNLAIKKRLFLTATPRHYDIKHRNREGDFRLVSMDEESGYGAVSHRLSFAAAVKQGIICPYKILISVTTKQEVDHYLLRHGTTLVKRDEIQARWVATQLALARAIERTQASKVITFHSRVALAQDFASAEARGISEHLENFEVLHVNGSQSTADRESLLRDFKTSEHGLITNARCLTEGVDVPAVDMVAFIDPKRSKVDIAQATGRAMRQSQATGKTTGYIVVPLFLEQQKGETQEQALERSGFEDVAVVVAAMLEQDEDLVDIISQLRIARGEAKPFNPMALVEKVEVLGPTIALDALRSAVSIAVIERLGESWDEMFGMLQVYGSTHGDYLVPAKYVTPEGKRLGSWVNAQRTLRHSIRQSRLDRLNGLAGWVWDVADAAWETGFKELDGYVAAHGDCLVPNNYVSPRGHRIGQWVGVQRGQRDSISEGKRHRLEQLTGWVWHVADAAWETGFKELEAYVAAHGDCLVPRNYVSSSGFRLGPWVGEQRAAKTRMSERRRRLLETKDGWVWEVLDARWENGLLHLRRYVNEHGSCLVPDGFETIDGFPLGQWVRHRRASRSNLSTERRKCLEALNGWVWDVRDAKWEKGFHELKTYLAAHDDCVVPANFITNSGFRLGRWINKQRSRRASLGPIREKRLEALPNWTWNEFDDRWEKGFNRLQAYVKEHGTSRVPQGTETIDKFRLGTWVSVQRRSKAEMPLDRRSRLENLIGWTWDTRSEAWEVGYRHLQRYVESNGDCLVPAKHKTIEGYRLGQWVSVQRAYKEAMSSERRRRLESLEGWVWHQRS
jgi:hypothetical protein